MKIVSQAKKVTIPRGWTFNSNRNSSSFCLILSGNFQVTFGKQDVGYIKKKEVDIKGFLSKNPGLSERIAVNK